MIDDTTYNHQPGANVATSITQNVLDEEQIPQQENTAPHFILFVRVAENEPTPYFFYYVFWQLDELPLFAK